MKTELQIRQALDAATLCGNSLPSEDAEADVYAALFLAFSWVLEINDAHAIDEVIDFVRERKQRIAERN